MRKREAIKTKNGSVLGYIETDEHGFQFALMKSGARLGRFDPKRNKTMNRSGSVIGEGNLLSFLIIKAHDQKEDAEISEKRENKLRRDAERKRDRERKEDYELKRAAEKTREYEARRAAEKKRDLGKKQDYERKRAAEKTQEHTAHLDNLHSEDEDEGNVRTSQGRPAPLGGLITGLAVLILGGVLLWHYVFTPGQVATGRVPSMESSASVPSVQNFNPSNPVATSQAPSAGTIGAAPDRDTQPISRANGAGASADVQEPGFAAERDFKRRFIELCPGGRALDCLPKSSGEVIFADPAAAERSAERDVVGRQSTSQGMADAIEDGATGVAARLCGIVVSNDSSPLGKHLAAIRLLNPHPNDDPASKVCVEYAAAYR